MKLMPCLVQRQPKSWLFDSMVQCRYASMLSCRSMQISSKDHLQLNNNTKVPHKVSFSNTTQNNSCLKLSQFSSILCGINRLYKSRENKRLYLSTPRSLFQRNYAFSRKSAYPDRDEDQSSNSNDEATADRHMLLRLTSENDLLSRCRNTYIMTLVALSALNLPNFPLTLTLSGVAVVTAELNLTFGTIYYLLNLLKLWKTQKLSTLVFLSKLFWTILHFTLWSLILGFLLPSGRKLDEELRNYTGEDE